MFCEVEFSVACKITLPCPSFLHIIENSKDWCDASDQPQYPEVVYSSSSINHDAKYGADNHQYCIPGKDLIIPWKFLNICLYLHMCELFVIFGIYKVQPG